MCYSSTAPASTPCLGSTRRLTSVWILAGAACAHPAGKRRRASSGAQLGWRHSRINLMGPLLEVSVEIVSRGKAAIRHRELTKIQRLLRATALAPHNWRRAMLRDCALVDGKNRDPGAPTGTICLSGRC